MTNGEWIKGQADKAGIPRRTLGQVKKSLAAAAKVGSDKAIARLMLEFGRLEDDAVAYVRDYLEGRA